MKTTTVMVQVAGKSYQLSGNEEAAYFQRLADIADRRLRETALQNPLLDPEACAVAAALSLTDELMKSQQLASKLREELEGQKKDQLDET
ncbi:MAG: cell division protein ZapA [Clostridiales bacterium]|nr:cell division protein ZapA [Clostridiales bacterium]